ISICFVISKPASALTSPLIRFPMPSSLIMETVPSAATCSFASAFAHLRNNIFVRMENNHMNLMKTPHIDRKSVLLTLAAALMPLMALAHDGMEHVRGTVAKVSDQSV